MTTQSYHLKSAFYGIVKNDINVYANLQCILEKIEEDRNLEQITNLYRQIFQREIVFTINGEVKRAQKTTRRNSEYEYSDAINDEYSDI